ncbi:MAG TPA: EVE domain-containing protein [Candidatus Baltobacteraceae bacterium]|nr:EVE domain-containing protein [Candidatus Baltobacteraceae bacterium]
MNLPAHCPQMRYWLFKSEPESYGFEHLHDDRQTAWSGVRNFQARNFMLEMRIGDEGFFYHSNIKDPAIVGIVRVVREAHADLTALDPKSTYYDPRATPDKPIWQLVDVAYERALPRPVTLTELRAHAPLAGMPLVQRGTRLSVQPVSPTQWKAILHMSERSPKVFRSSPGNARGAGARPAR